MSAAAAACARLENAGVPARCGVGVGVCERHARPRPRRATGMLHTQCELHLHQSIAMCAYVHLVYLREHLLHECAHTHVH